jgi:hypothetical protein
MLDQSFCISLEYCICEAFESYDVSGFKGFWCDGVLLSKPMEYYSKKYVNDKKVITIKAFIGQDGQTEYEVFLKLGNTALSRFARDLDISACMPSAFNDSNFIIDTKKREIEIQLE